MIASNRGPFSFSEEFIQAAVESVEKGELPEPQDFGAGGLVGAMAGLLKGDKWDTTWIGASLGEKDIDVARGHYDFLFKRMRERKIAPDHFPLIQIDEGTRMHFTYKEYDYHMRFAFFDTKHMHSYYSKFANGFLWPLMHLTRSPLFYKKTPVFPRPHFEKNDFVQYTSSGVTLANTIIDEIDKKRQFKKEKIDIVVWNQDYHLMQIAEVLKALLLENGEAEEEKGEIHVGQFMHTPFFNIHEIQGLIREDKRRRVKEQILDPFSESIDSVLQKLSWGLLSNDFIGFHTKEYCDNYLEALEEWFPVQIKVVDQSYEIIRQNGVTTLAAFPIGVDVDKILSEVSDGKRLEYTFEGEDLYERILAEKTNGSIVFGGLERCDYTKGLLERLNIFARVFNKLKNEKKDARFYQVTALSRSDNPDYQKLQAALEGEVVRINEKFKEAPVIHVAEGISPPQNYRFMKEVDVMLVTPLEDGMNLVAFEYILSQKFRHPTARGMLILSKSGASRVLEQNGFNEQDGLILMDTMKAKRRDGKNHTGPAQRTSSFGENYQLCCKGTPGGRLGGKKHRRYPELQEDRMTSSNRNPYPPISDYAYIADCHSSALVSRSGSIDWCCMPRIDSGSCFGRILDWEKGGYCRIGPVNDYEISRTYVEDSLILETTFRHENGKARLLDFFTMRKGGEHRPHQQILRILEGIEGMTRFEIDIVPRFDYGSIRPWIRTQEDHSYILIGGHDGLLISSDFQLDMKHRHRLMGSCEVESGERGHLSILYRKPEDLDEGLVSPPPVDELDHRLDETLDWWRSWASRGKIETPYATCVRRSAVVLKGLSNAPTGAIAAAATTSLPEIAGGSETGITASVGFGIPPLRFNPWENWAIFGKPTALDGLWSERPRGTRRKFRSCSEWVEKGV